ncbi:uncharacterized protein CLUP02_14380 [Colletotrichum lupini]|uniref:Uncharacterized protein n=1 Tax=Colletotrichum lupini TaxID=145971 RepID=A0A9Q8WMJ7_9PEZI|nr:uncharacterized protein CLUP02_14380 [Colletotrichum lupini]UQC88854.1 hypothetical protein CLUP02_14380 [Colletotrichum lupini]
MRTKTNVRYAAVSFVLSLLPYTTCYIFIRLSIWELLVILCIESQPKFHSLLKSHLDLTCSIDVSQQYLITASTTLCKLGSYTTATATQYECTNQTMLGASISHGPRRQALNDG